METKKGQISKAILNKKNNNNVGAPKYLILKYTTVTNSMILVYKQKHRYKELSKTNPNI